MFICVVSQYIPIPLSAFLSSLVISSPSNVFSSSLSWGEELGSKYSEPFRLSSWKSELCSSNVFFLGGAKNYTLEFKSN